MKRMSQVVLHSIAILAAVATLSWFPDRALAQFTTASLSGAVTDTSGAAVPDAKVTVQNTETGFTLSVTTGPAGDYLFSRLPVGDYKLTVDKGGFTKYVQSGIQLAVNQT